jgi:carboxyl-terminal processing protease
VNVSGTVGAFEKIDLGGGRFAFTFAKELVAGGSPAQAVPFEEFYAHAPPTLDVQSSSMATRDEKVKVTGVASDTERLLDVYMFVGSRKLYYKSNRDGPDPKKATFEFDAPLRPGVNVITVVARETPDTTTRRTIIVRKDGPDGAVLKTPKTDDPINEWMGQPSED